MDIKKGIKEKKDAYCNEYQGTEKKYKRDDRKDKKKHNYHINFKGLIAWP